MGTGGETYPSIMCRIPQFTSLSVLTGAPDAPHPMFVVDDIPYPELMFSKYQNVVVNGRAYSLPAQDPRVYITFDEAKTACETKGRGWHLATNAEYAGIALWCKQNGFMPRGNNYYGGDYTARHEQGSVCYTYNDGGTIRKGRTLTGSGPVSWNHDGSPAGICDLNGNVWERAGGGRLKNGEIQVIPHNNAAKHIDQSDTSVQWKAILPDGSFVAPGTANTLKYDSVSAGTVGQVGAIQLNTVISNSNAPASGDDGYIYNTFETLTAKSGVNVPIILKMLGLFPVDASHGGDGLWVRNYGERLPLRGGSWNNGSGAGVFALSVHVSRAHSSHYVGFRAAFVNL
ncbi:hypothetical protein SDC9_75682 [bioreactor metagenome]|uniref:Sulfatase-modifying factor enzyme-like domain-containing protein n=1 Tax=bioreactor metagenome TaxID=1076179 RepID=A0A644YKH5_9ZZZZ